MSKRELGIGIGVPSQAQSLAMTHEAGGPDHRRVVGREGDGRDEEGQPETLRRGGRLGAKKGGFPHDPNQQQNPPPAPPRDDGATGMRWEGLGWRPGSVKGLGRGAGSAT